MHIIRHGRLNVCYSQLIEHYVYFQLKVTLPEGRCSHFAAVWHEGIIIGGGMNDQMVPIGSCVYLSYTDQWQLTAFDFKPLLPNK